jgi:hypothetical protein
MHRPCPGHYSRCLGIKLPCGCCYHHCQCPRGAHDRYIISIGEIRVMAAQAASSAAIPPSKRR